MIIRKKVVLLTGIINALLMLRSINSEACARKSTCSCECSQGEIDFSALSLEPGPRYKDYASLTDQYKYSYNPCKSFTETSTGAFEDHCKDVAACQAIVAGGTYYQFYDTGTQDSVTFYTELGNKVGFPDIDYDVVVAKYVSSDKGRQTEVILVCNEDSSQTEFDVIGEITTKPPTYRFTLVSPEVCFKNVGLSAGSILLIIVFAGIAAYFLVGVAIKKFVFKASGTSELIPNSGFWLSLPDLVKNGCFYIVRRGKSGKQYAPV